MSGRRKSKTLSYLDLLPNVHSTFLGRSGYDIVEHKGTQKGNNHGRSENGQRHGGTITVTKGIFSPQSVKVSTGPGHGETVEQGKANDELVAWTVEIHVLQVGETDGHNESKEGTVNARCHGVGHGSKESSDLGNQGDANHNDGTTLHDGPRSYTRDGQGTNVFTVGRGGIGGSNQARQQYPDTFASQTPRNDTRRRRRSPREVGTSVVISNGFNHGSQHTSQHGNDGVGLEDGGTPLSGVGDPEPWGVVENVRVGIGTASVCK
eukprot:scaffold490_cov186-Amphora_coffeaeformis.AAC.3